MAYLNTVAGASREGVALAGAAEISRPLVLGEEKNISGIRHVVHLGAASQTLTEAQSGDKFVGVADAVFTLPLVEAGTLLGVHYEFECGDAGGSVGISISPAVDNYIIGNGLTAVDDKDLINTAATDRVGDMVRIYCDRDNGWIIESIIGTWAKEA